MDNVRAMFTTALHTDEMQLSTFQDESYQIKSHLYPAYTSDVCVRDMFGSCWDHVLTMLRSCLGHILKDIFKDEQNLTNYYKL